MTVRPLLALSLGTWLGSGGAEVQYDIRISYVANLLWADMDDVIIGGYS